VTATLPTGTVTFLFDDIEGSTKLFDRVGSSEYAHPLGINHEAMRDTRCELPLRLRTRSESGPSLSLATHFVEGDDAVHVETN
jgi:class 3 adenylate cyclase